jgi:hypothetical protein
MFSKRSIIAALVGLNLVLLATLVLKTTSPQAAFAQRRGGSQNFVAVTCRADKDFDALYMIDLSQRKLHCFVPNRDRSGSVVYAGVRDLKTDFER